MHKAVLLLTLESDLVFSSRAATLGGHAGLDHIPGAALWGWAASRLYGKHRLDSHTLFHSGKVRFGNGLPITSDGKIGFPVPRVLTIDKGERGWKDKDTQRLVPHLIRNAATRESEKTAENGKQEALKSGYITPDGFFVKPLLGYRLKTAIESGRAAEGQLFGYEHIPAGTRFAAHLEADDGDQGVSPDAFETLMSCFAGQSLALGRSRRAEYGGEIRCEVVGSKGGFWPESSVVQSEQDVVSVWLLSDLVLDDEFGSPCLSPPSTAFGLPELPLLPQHSAIGIRRYASFNGYLRRPELERAVIEAGSVLSYDTSKITQTIGAEYPSGFGLFREHGLGRVWINPPLLQMAPAVVVSLPHSAMPSSDDEYAASLVAWAQRAQEGRDLRASCDEAFECYKQEIRNLYVSARRISGNPLAGPGSSQWGRVLELCGRVDIDFAALKAALVQSAPKGAAQPICSGEGWEDRGVPRHRSEQDQTDEDRIVTFSTWMKHILNDDRWRNKKDATTLKETLGRIAEFARAADRITEAVQESR